MTKQELKAWILYSFPQFEVLEEAEMSIVFRGVFSRDASNEMWKAVNKKTSEAGLRAYLSIKGDAYRLAIIWLANKATKETER